MCSSSWNPLSSFRLRTGLIHYVERRCLFLEFICTCGVCVFRFGPNTFTESQTKKATILPFLHWHIQLLPLLHGKFCECRLLRREVILTVEESVLCSRSFEEQKKRSPKKNLAKNRLFSPNFKRFFDDGLLVKQKLMIFFSPRKCQQIDHWSKAKI